MDGPSERKAGMMRYRFASNKRSGGRERVHVKRGGQLRVTLLALSNDKEQQETCYTSTLSPSSFPHVHDIEEAVVGLWPPVELVLDLVEV